MCQENNLPSNKPVMNNLGWQCPKCGNVYAPFIHQCGRCNNLNIKYEGDNTFEKFMQPNSNKPDIKVEFKHDK